MNLVDETCTARLAGTAVSDVDLQALLRQVPCWTASEGRIRREVKMRTFGAAIDLVNAVADLAEAEDHHPDLCVSYDRVLIVLTTHGIGGLSVCDFIMAAKIDRLPLLAAVAPPSSPAADSQDAPTG